MHEASVATGILDIVRQHVPAADALRVRAVRVRIGDMAGVVPDSLGFCFEAIVSGTEYASAFLEIDRVPARGVCGECGLAAAIDSLPPFMCPSCSSPFITVTSGDDLAVVDVELDDVAGGQP
jgi:hydrogenase nickel incorporation protein HypA/HybF